MSRCTVLLALTPKPDGLPMVIGMARQNPRAYARCLFFIVGATALLFANPAQLSNLSSFAVIARPEARLSAGLQGKSGKTASGPIVFTGSSSIAYWDSLAKDMKPLTVVNSAFGGAQYSDLLDRLDELVIAYRPSAVVVYAGDNDLAPGSPKTPQSVAMDVQQFVTRVQSELPGSWVYVLSIKPSYAHWSSWHKMRDANRLIQKFLRTRERTQYIDVASSMFDASGNLPRDLFISDGLHPTAKCYALWTSIIKPALLERFGPGANSRLVPGAR